ncbi:MAG: hypothetical protein EXR28_02165 [Betaproteobacteria bacterium]|nr:hypothetical protein [Betaproteobacteria bacterium]
MNLGLPSMTADAAPAFIDAKSCAQWLQELPLANVGPTHGRLLGELEELNGFEMPPGERIKVLELLREAVLFVQTEQSRKFSGKPVPLAKQERELFLNVIALWDAFALGWRHCLQNLDQGIGGISGQAAIICQRCLWSLGAKLSEHYKVYQEFNAEEWRRLNRIFAFADGLGVAEQSVAHPATKSASGSSCAETFSQIQLLTLANPNEHPPRQQALIARWIERWGRKAKFSPAPPKDSSGTPLGVDLESDACATRSAKAGGQIIYIDTSEIGKSLRKRAAALKAGETPESLHLGEDVTEGLAAQMMVMLHQKWCEDKTARQSQRRKASEHAQVCAGLAAIHYAITGRPFDARSDTASLSAQQRAHFETFGQLSTRANENYTLAHGLALEHWRILDESVSGFRLERPHDGGAGRFLHQQLLAVRPMDAPSFSLCSVRWISLSENQTPRLGTRTMPGIARGIAARLGGLNVRSEKFLPALMLPALPALRSPATLIIPAGWFRHKRLIEIQGGAPASDLSNQVLLTAALERGSDFERCTFELA